MEQASLVILLSGPAGSGKTAVADAIFPAWPEAGYARWVEALQPIEPLLVVLLPAFEVVVRRNAPRSGHRRLRAETLRQIYDMMLPWRDAGVPIIDNTTLSVEQTAAQLNAIIADGTGVTTARP